MFSKQFRPVKWYTESHASFFTTFMYISLHDVIDFDGFDHTTFEKKNFLTAIFYLFWLHIIGIFLLKGNAYISPRPIVSKATMPVPQI